jgi:asparagine synthase (glutamine-hydrolysing)
MTMSGIVGIYYLDGRPVDRDLLIRLTRVIDHRGPDGIGYWTGGPVGLGHCMLHSTPESRYEKQPLLDETGQLCLTLDGRVDNRDALRNAIEARGFPLRADTDAELVLRAYQCWGEQCPQEIIGDFAFVIWDGRQQQLFCARDILGIRPFYFYTNTRIFLWGSELRVLFEEPSVPREPNEGMVGEYLANHISSKEETLFQGVMRLPPAHSLIVRPDLLSKVCYWDLNPQYSIRYRTDQEYCEHFLTIFREAVRCRLRSNGVVGALLSGGLDSSSVVCMAQWLYQNSSVVNNKFETFSLVFPGQPCDESEYIQDVVGQWKIKSTTLCPELPVYTHLLDQVKCYYDLPDYPNGAMADVIKTWAQKNGVRVMLTGVGGDEWYTGSFYHYADLLRTFQILSLIRLARCDPHVPSLVPLPSNPFLRWALYPLIPASVRRVAQYLKRPKDGTPAWMNRQFAQKIHLAERLHTRTDWKRFASFAQAYNYRTLHAYMTHALEMEERAAAWFGYELRHPFCDRRAIEYSFALPDDQHWRPRQGKFVLRQAMKGLLPDSIQQRRTKTEFSVVFVEALLTHGAKHFTDTLAIAAAGWVDKEQVSQMWQEMRKLYRQGNGGYSRYLYPLWYILGLELWFNEVF